MAINVYRYRFQEQIALEDVEAALLLAIWACEALHGEAQTRLDAAHYLDLEARACVIDAGTDVGRDFCRLFLTFIRRECGEDCFQVEHVDAPNTAAI